MTVAPNWGKISSDDWTYALSQYSKFGLAGFDASSSSAQYSNLIDMSYADAAANGS
jgi:hypothetical protein